MFTGLPLLQLSTINNMKTSPRSPSSKGIGKTNGNGFRKAKGGSNSDVSTSKPSKKERNALIQRYMTIDWSSITADHPYILALASLRLAPALTLPSDKSTVLTMAFSSFGPMILNFVLLSIKIEPADFPSSKKSKIALIVATIMNKNNLLKSDMTVNVNKVKMSELKTVSASFSQTSHLLLFRNSPSRIITLKHREVFSGSSRTR